MKKIKIAKLTVLFVMTCNIFVQAQREIILGQVVRSQKPCGDKEISTYFDSESSSYHHYTVENKICTRKRFDLACNRHAIFSKMISQVRFITPTDLTTPVTDCMIVNVNIFDIPFNKDDVRVMVDSSNYTVTNFTRANHVLHRGLVRRTIVERASSIYVVTEGEGVGSFGNANSYMSKTVWGSVDRALIAATGN